jgi:hypothetical protein
VIKILIVAGSWIGVMALIGVALLCTKKIADWISAARAKTDEKRAEKKCAPPADEFRNPFYISEKELSAVKEQTENSDETKN